MKTVLGVNVKLRETTWNYVKLITEFASDTHNLDHMYPYQLLVAVTKKKMKTVLGGKCETTWNYVKLIIEFLIKSLSIHVISGFHIQSIQIALYLLQQH